ncbi:hypothetical protein EC957_011836 [Mortierella hygrophila]|uniref:Uncharacterized protein n=1 Tax=Mortierella hygrophila TaxID=979708 RepID=A0A9P6K3M7_9FUNG|nr:hypothetical protein EC957_011836 [Mortierella hygrophila]
MSDSAPPPLFQQAIQGILARNVTNNYVSLPVHYHQPTGTRYIPMNILRNMYPGIIRLQVDGQTLEPRRGLPTAQSMFESVLSQWVDETSVVSDAEDGERSYTPYPETVSKIASSSFVIVAQDDKNAAVVGAAGVSQENQESTVNTFDHDDINPSLLSEPVSQALFDGDTSASTLEWIEYRPDSVIQVVHYTPGPIETTSGAASSQSGTGMAEGDYPPSFWARIRQEIQTAVRQVYQELTEEQAKVHKGNSSLNDPTEIVAVPSPSPPSSWILTERTTNQTRLPSEHSIILLSSSSPSPSIGSQGSGSQSDDMEEDVVVVTKPADSDSKSKCKAKKRDRDDDVGEFSSISSGSEKKLRSSATLPRSVSSSADDGDDEDECSVSLKSSPPKTSSHSGSDGAGSSSRPGSGPSSGSRSESSYEPRSGSSSSSSSGSSRSGKASSGSSSGSGSSEPTESHGYRFASPAGSSPGVIFDPGQGSFGLDVSRGSNPGSPSGSGSSPASGSPLESYAIAESAAVTPEPRNPLASLEMPVPPPVRGKRALARDSQSDELNQADAMVFTVDEERDQLGCEIISVHSSESGDIEDDDTQPLRFTPNQLRDFVARRKGLLVGESQAVTICLKTSKEARQFYRFLRSQDYFGKWLNIKLTWAWDREQLGSLVDALIVSPIEVLFLDGCVACAASTSVASTATEANTSVSSLRVASTSQEGDSRSVDSKFRTRRYDPLVRLFRFNQFKELHFYDLPDLFYHSIAPIPWDLSHLTSFRLHAEISDWESVQANRFLQFVKRATNLEHLYIGCPTERYNMYVDEITRATDRSERSKSSPPLDIHFQHHHHRHTLLRVRYDPLDREFKAFEVDLIGTSQQSNIQWKPVLGQLISGTLVSLSLDNMPDETWMYTVMEWVYSVANDRGVGLDNLQLDCMHFGPIQFQNLVELLELAQPRLQTLDLRNVYISFASNTSSPSETSATMQDCDLDYDITQNDADASVPIIDWPTLVKALNISVLQALRIRTCNLQDRDIDGVVECLKAMVRNSKKLALEKVLLKGAQLSAKGERTLVREIQAILPGVDVKFR